MRIVATAFVLAGIAWPAGAQEIPELPSLREQVEIRQEWLVQRLETVLPRLMRENHIDMWIVQMSEYNEDPVFRALVSPTRFAARRRSIFVFYDRGPDEGVERLALGGGDQGGAYIAVREADNPGRELYLDAQWRMLREVVEERRPRRHRYQRVAHARVLGRARVGRARASRACARAEVVGPFGAGQSFCHFTTWLSVSRRWARTTGR